MLIKPPSRTDLHSAYHAEGCPVCALLDRSERRYIDATLYEHVTDVKWRGEVRAARGFCALHTARVLDVGRSALGVTLVAADLLNTLRGELAAAGSARGRVRSMFGGGGGAATGLKPQQPCPICAYVADLANIYVAALLDDVATSDGSREYGASAGLCLPHLIRSAERGGAGWEAVRSHQLAAWERLEGELSEFARKNDYQYSGEPIQSERDAWRRALLLLGGKQPT
jgi:hypothetical protein